MSLARGRRCRSACSPDHTRPRSREPPPARARALRSPSASAARPNARPPPSQGVIFATFWAVLTILKEPVLLLCLLLVAKGWCITRRSLERREVCVVGVILSLLYASVSVEMSVDSWLALAPMVLMYLIMLYEICSSILSNLRILKAQILALRSLGVDPLTTPAHTKYRMYCRLLGLVFVYALVETVLHWSYSAGRYAMSTFLTVHQLMELVIAVGIGHTFRARHFNVLFTQVQQVAAELADQMLPSITTVQLKETELQGQNLIAWRPTLNLPSASSAPSLPPTLVVLNPGDSELPQPPRSARRPPGLAGLAAPPPGPPPREDEGNDVELLPMPDRRLDEARSATSERGAIVPSIAREVSLPLDDGDRAEVV